MTAIRIIAKPLCLILLCFLTKTACGTSPSPGGGGSPFPTALNSWSFWDTNTWLSDEEYAPISFTNLVRSPMGNINGFSMMLDDTNGAWLHFNVVEGDNATNLTVAVGTVSFWFAPNWASANTNQNGTGPGQWGRFIEVGAYTENADSGWWSLFLDEAGTNIHFAAQTNSGDSETVTYLSAPINWESNFWHNIVLTYSTSNSALYVDGQLATTGAVVSAYPSLDVLANGFWIGSDGTGAAQARGVFDDVHTYDVPLSALEVQFLYGRDNLLYGLNPRNRRKRMASAPSTPSYSPVFNAVTGAGFLIADATNAVSCLTHSNIWITNVVATVAGNGTMNVSFEIAGGTNNVLYDVFANSVVPATSELTTAWSWMGRGYHCVTYTLTNLPNQSSFLILGTPQNSDFDGLTDAYELLVSKTLKDDADTDDDGWTDGEEVVIGTDPNTIHFSLFVPNKHASANPAAVNIHLHAGNPSSIAVLIDNPNLSAAVWEPYNSNSTVSVSGSEGWHTVRVGLRGGNPTSQQTWQRLKIKLDLTPPLLVITNPPASVVSRPLIQLQGYCPEPLARLTYDLTNAAGLFTDRQALVLDQAFDTNVWEFATNFFQAFDIELAEGLNTITLHATDFAGNVTNVVLDYTRDYSGDTTAPAIQPLWPINGTRVSGEQFTGRGWLDDATANIKAQTVAGGETNFFNGRVDRKGGFWIEDIPLLETTNLITLIATDVAGNISSNTVTVIKSSLTLTIDPVEMDYGASGTISDTNYAVWINGSRATVYPNGTWDTYYSHVTVASPAAQVRAIPLTDNGGNGSGFSGDVGNPDSSMAVDVETSFEWPSEIAYPTEMHWDDGHTFWYHDGTVQNFYRYGIDWSQSGGGNEVFVQGGGSSATNLYFYQWKPGAWPDIDALYYSSITPFPTNWIVSFPYQPNYYSGEYFHSRTYSDGLRETYRRDQTQMSMVTGGAPGEDDMDLYEISGQAVAIEPPLPNNYVDSYYEIPSEQISVSTLGNLDTNGILYAALPKTTPVNLTPRVITGTNFYGIVINGKRHTLVSQCVALWPANRARTTLGVGEQVILNFSPLLSKVSWSTSAGSVSPAEGNTIFFTAPSNAVDRVIVTATKAGKSVRKVFTVVKPTGFAHAHVLGTNSYGLGVMGAGMTNQVWIAPTNVSLYRVQIMEIGQDATNITGYFTNHAPHSHIGNGADVWISLNETNQWKDWAHISGRPPPWQTGSFKWMIPTSWKVGGGPTNSMENGWDQVFSVDASGGTTVKKFNRTVTRNTNNVYTTVQ